MNSSSKNNRKNAIPQWQIDKMKTIIGDRWQEVWEVVNLRSKDKD